MLFFVYEPVPFWQNPNGLKLFHKIYTVGKTKNSQNNYKKQVPRLSASFPANRRFVQKFYMVACVTEAGLGPEFALLCRSFFRWSRLVLRHQAHLYCPHCLFFRWRSLYCCAGRLASPKCYPAGPSRASLN